MTQKEGRKDRRKDRGRKKVKEEGKEGWNKGGRGHVLRDGKKTSSNICHF